MKKLTLLAFLFCSSLAFAGHPASDRVVDALEDAFRIIDLPPSSQPRSMCSFIKRYLDYSDIGGRLLGRYSRSGDTNGVRDFIRETPSFMATKAFEKIKDLKGESGSYSVGNPSERSGQYTVPVTVRTAKGKSYSVRATLSSSLKLLDVHYLGFSGVGYAARDVQSDIQKFERSSSTPVSAFVQDLRSQKGFVSCR